MNNSKILFIKGIAAKRGGGMPRDSFNIIFNNLNDFTDVRNLFLYTARRKIQGPY